jgi:hypothetical protein
MTCRDKPARHADAHLADSDKGDSRHGGAHLERVNSTGASSLLFNAISRAVSSAMQGLSPK